MLCFMVSNRNFGVFMSIFGLLTLLQIILASSDRVDRTRLDGTRLLEELPRRTFWAETFKSMHGTFQTNLLNLSFLKREIYQQSFVGAFGALRAEKNERPIPTSTTLFQPAMWCRQPTAAMALGMRFVCMFVVGRSIVSMASIIMHQSGVRSQLNS